MFQMSYEDVVKRIQQERKLSLEDIEKRVDEKIKQLNDLISRQGAAHILANQLGIKVMEMSNDSFLKVSEIPVGLSSLNTNLRIINIYGIREYNKNERSGRVANFLAGDGTGAVRVVVWDENLIKNIENEDFKEGDIIRIRNGYTKENNGFKEIHLGGKAAIEVNPSGVDIDNVKKYSYNLTRKKISELNEGDSVELLGTVVQMFDVRFYHVCPICNKKVFLEDMKFRCVQHGDIEARKVPVLNFFLDDGSSNIRIVAFNDQVKELTEREELDINVEEFEKLRNTILGKQVLVRGKVNKNAKYDRLEFISRGIREADPVEILNEM